MRTSGKHVNIQILNGNYLQVGALTTIIVGVTIALQIGVGKYIDFDAITKQKTPTQIAEETKLAISHVSRTLSEFKDKGIVECLTPDEKIGKLYALTKKGSKVLKSLF